MADKTFLEYLDGIWRFALAQVFTLMLLFMGLITFAIPSAAVVKPYLLLAAVYYWTIYRPNLIPAMFVFALGLLSDLIAGQPYVGVTALILLTVQFVLRDQRLYMMGQPFLMLWLGYGMTCIGAGVVFWLVFTVLSFSINPALPMVYAVLISILIFPFLALIFHLINRLLPARVILP